MDHPRKKTDKSTLPSQRADERRARRRHRGVGREGMDEAEHIRPTGNEQGLGHEGAVLDRRHQCPEGRSTTMPERLLDKIPQWLKSLYHMENELRSAAQNGLILRNEKASEHLAAARRHLDEALRAAKGEEPPAGPQTPMRKEGEF
jgi:hypothetical protein